MMADNKHPLEIEVTETSAADCPHILLFSYVQDGERKRLPYEVRKTHLFKVADYMQRKDIAPDLSEVKTPEDAKKFKEEFMKQYPIADKVYEHLFDFGTAYAQNKKNRDVAQVVHETSICEFRMEKLSDEERQECWDYVRNLCEAKALGMKLDQVPTKKRPLLHVLGIKREPLITLKEDFKKQMGKLEYSKDIWKSAFEALPEICPKTDKFSHDLGEKWLNDKRLRAAIDAVASDFIDIKIKEDVEKVLDGKLRIHLQKLEKEKKVKRQLEEKKAEKIKIDRLNKSKGAEAKAVAERKCRAQDRLAKKGLMPKRGEKSGKSVNWGDSRKQGR